MKAFYKRYPADLQKEPFASFTAEQLGWFGMLLDAMWTARPQGWIAESEHLKICRNVLPPDDLQPVLALFEVHNGQMCYPPLIEQIDAELKIRKSYADRGKKGGRPRKLILQAKRKREIQAFLDGLPEPVVSGGQVKLDAIPPGTVVGDQIRIVAGRTLAEGSKVQIVSPTTGEVSGTATVEAIPAGARFETNGSLSGLSRHSAWRDILAALQPTLPAKDYGIIAKMQVLQENTQWITLDCPGPLTLTVWNSYKTQLRGAYRKAGFRGTVQLKLSKWAENALGGATGDSESPEAS